MNNDSLEQLSALIDGGLGEGDGQGLLHKTNNDESLRAAWVRYHLIGEGLRQNLPHAIDPDFAERVTLALDNEPAILPPQRAVRSRLKPVAGVALAASVAAIAVLTVKRMGVDPAHGERPPGTEQSLMTTSQLPIATMRWTAERPPPSVRLNTYLVNHNQYKSDLRMEGVSPYFRIVGHDTDQ